MKEYDVLIIGSGPGGYICAIRCAQLGMKVAIVEKYKKLGGTCLNVGCIPSKAWLDSSKKYHELIHSFSEHGIEVQNTKLDFLKMSERVKKVVSDVSTGISFLMKKNKIDVYLGVGSFEDENTVCIKNAEENNVIKALKIIIATGSKPSSLPGIVFDKKRIITSTEALSLNELPKKLIVIGAGVVGLELSSVFKRLGAEVVVIEYADAVIANMERELSKSIHKILKKDGIEFFLGYEVLNAETNGEKVIVRAKDKKSETIMTFEGDYCLVAVGRSPYTEGLNLKAINIKLDERGRIETDSHLQTNISHIYAIGDVVKGAMLAHKAEEEGIMVAEYISGQRPHINYNLIPSVVYTWPEVSSVGFTEEQLMASGREFKVGNFPFKASGRARASNESEGFIKVIADKKSDEILGVHMIGPRCADLIGEAGLAMEYRASAEDVARISHAHPTYSESFKEACLAATENRALNM